jgi:hypothetical protein
VCIDEAVNLVRQRRVHLCVDPLGHLSVGDDAGYLWARTEANWEVAVLEVTFLGEEWWERGWYEGVSDGEKP